MGLTVTEREDWKDRIAMCMDRAMRDVYCVKEPGLLTRIRDEAKRQAATLNLTDLMARQEENRLLLAKFEKKGISLVAEMVATVRSCTPAEVDVRSYCGVTPWEVKNAIDDAASRIEEELLGQDDLGREVLALRQEKEELLDTVWLATSGKPD